MKMNMNNWWIDNDRERIKTCPAAPLYNTSHGLNWDRTQTSAEERPRITITIYKYSPYRAVNTLRLSYTNQSVNVV